MSQKLNLGDLIEIDRRGYQHWAIYVGDGYVVHLVSADGSRPNTSFSLSASTKKALVKKQRLSEVTEGNKWRVKNKHDNKYSPKSRQEIVQSALQMVGKKIDYNVVTMNFEHFANNLRYGRYECDQVIRGAGILGAVGTVLAATAAFGFGVMRSLGRQ
ncbi:phospholipase A and acyltransferase 2-like [Sceloporus undulatus]|uniref:phospholipase A and acyltransferase 2-like n=1 Tax=Sceloporus undulatus TaxID=8520 RepID=UPI001C4D1B2B|nr:phospholipase A and acyltransferase 2-like [Sceloporus undulatus]